MLYFIFFIYLIFDTMNYDHILISYVTLCGTIYSACPEYPITLHLVHPLHINAGPLFINRRLINIKLPHRQFLLWELLIQVARYEQIVDINIGSHTTSIFQFFLLRVRVGIGLVMGRNKKLKYTPYFKIYIILSYIILIFYKKYEVHN